MQDHNVDYNEDYDDDDEFTSLSILTDNEIQSVYNRQLIPEQELESPSIE